MSELKIVNSISFLIFILILFIFLFWNLELEFSIILQLLYIMTRYNSYYKSITYITATVTQSHNIEERYRKFQNNDII